MNNRYSGRVLPINETVLSRMVASLQYNMLRSDSFQDAAALMTGFEFDQIQRYAYEHNVDLHKFYTHCVEVLQNNDLAFHKFDAWFVEFLDIYK